MIAFTIATLTLVMIVAGATVTTIRAGDSDPEWSLAFWKWFRSAEGGLFYELLHRKIGTVIGFLGIALVVMLWRNEPRRWVRRLGYFVFVLVCVQGLLGGLRVKAVSSREVQDFLVALTGLDAHFNRFVIAMVHATTAQITFCAVVLLALVTSRGWVRGEVATERSPATSKTRRLAIFTCAMVLVQLVLGAYVRHGRVLYPDEPAPGFQLVLLLHIAMALGVAGHLYLVNQHTRRHHPRVFPIWHIAGLAQFLALFQLCLGFGAWAFLPRTADHYQPPWDVAMLVRVLHVANGAMIFAIAVTLTARSWKLLSPGTAAETETASRLSQREAHA